MALPGLLADAVLVLHAALVAFVVAGLPLVIAGNTRWQWPLVNSLWFRGLHALAIGTVVAEAWLGIACPLTVWEQALRQAAGQAGYTGGFVQHALHAALFWQAPAWIFTLAYSAFGLCVVAAWWRWPPRRTA